MLYSNLLVQLHATHLVLSNNLPSTNLLPLPVPLPVYSLPLQVAFPSSLPQCLHITLHNTLFLDFSFCHIQHFHKAADILKCFIILSLWSPLNNNDMPLYSHGVPQISNQCRGHARVIYHR